MYVLSSPGSHVTYVRERLRGINMFIIIAEDGSVFKAEEITSAETEAVAQGVLTVLKIINLGAVDVFDMDQEGMYQEIEVWGSPQESSDAE